MSTRKIIMLGLALVVGVMTYLSFKSTVTPQQAAPVVEATQVLAAARDLPTGTIIKDLDMKWIPWPEGDQNSKLFFKGKTDMGSLVGAVLREGLHADEPFLNGRVVQPHEQGFLAAVLMPGMRAVSVTLTPSAGVAGFIFPGDHVDVILTHSFLMQNDKGGSGTVERRLSETLIRDARVLALDQKSDNQSTDPKVAQLATLEVTSHQAEKLILAADMASGGSGKGALALVLRSLAAEDPAAAAATKAAETDDGPTMDSDISPVYSRMTQTSRVEVMRGKEISESVFQKMK